LLRNVVIHRKDAKNAKGLHWFSFIARYAIGTKASNATEWAKATAPNGPPGNETILGWIHQYN
jgi:hypothetical protein